MTVAAPAVHWLVLAFHDLRAGDSSRPLCAKATDFGHVVARYAEQSLGGITDIQDDDEAQLARADDPN